MIAHFRFTTEASQAGQTLLECLLPAVPYLPEARWLELIEQGLVLVNGSVCKACTVMQNQQEISYTINDHEEGEVDCNWKLIWHNHDIAAIHKPANLPVSRTTRNVYNTLIQLLRRESPWPDAHLLHRLDLETSGLILVAHNKEAAKLHQPNLAQLIEKKIYHAVVHGEPNWQTLDYQSHLNTLKDSAIRCKMHKVEEGQGKLSQTRFKVLAANNGYSLIECELLTGRKHQIRAHLSQLGHAIVGDKIYSHGGQYYLNRLQDALTQQDYDAMITDHHLLHAFKLTLHINGEKIELCDEFYPTAFADFLQVHNLTLKE